MASQDYKATARQTHLQRWLKIDPGQKPAIYAQIDAEAEVSDPNYWLQILFSAGIAALGLVLNSPAVIIGAMLISPLMSPIMAAGLALASGDLYLLVKSTVNLVASIALAVGFSALIVWLLPFHSVTGEILARTNPTLLDLGVALFSGLAGSVAVSRVGGRDGMTTLPGVAVAVALMPPLCTMGFGLGSGAPKPIVGGAGLLFLTNLVAIVASAFAVFLLVGMNTPDVRSEVEQARKGEFLDRAIERGRLSQAFVKAGQLRWRILVLAILLGVVAIPLRKAFVQVAGEALVRSAVQDVVKGLLPPGALVSQQVDVGRESVAVRLLSTSGIPAAKIEVGEREIERRSGRHATLSVDTIASQSELAELMQKLTAPPPPPPAPPQKTLQQIHDEVLHRLTPILAGVWPPQAPLQDFDIEFAQNGMVVDVRYASQRELDKMSLDILTRELQQKLETPDLSLAAKRVRPPRKALR